MLLGLNASISVHALQGMDLDRFSRGGDSESKQRHNAFYVKWALQGRSREKADVEFIPENGGGAGVRLAKRSKRPMPMVALSTVFAR
jgi:hypothetical protein